MKPYDKTQEKCIYGHFDMTRSAGYVLTNGEKLKAPWYYIYNNRKVLLYVDQNGPVKIQHQPPNGILAIKREMGENQSKWQVWIQSKDLNDGIPVSNFNSPTLQYNLSKPEFLVNWMPEKAIYTLRFDTADIITEIFVPCDKATVSMKTTIVNKNDKPMEFVATPALFPYVNIPQMVAWDLPEWYLSTKVMKCGKMLTIHGQMTSPEMDKKANRSVTFNINYEKSAELELDMSEFGGAGNFFSPDKVKNGTTLSYNMSEADGITFCDYQAVYAARYKFTLNSGDSKTLTQVLTFQEDVSYNEAENLFDETYFDDSGYAERMKLTENFYNDLFSKRRIKTDNELYNNFVNYFTPLEMFWVCSLDRGWPSSMRGIRDASQDFMGMVHLNPDWTRETILDMFLHQRKDGWMPRQISTVSRQAPHDMRYYSDGGAFLLELLHEYMTFTRDTDILNEKVMWLDSDKETTVLEHIKACAEFYLCKKNIGEHGLCKVWYGDWWDPMDKIGMEGRGESVTVTAQMVLNLKNLADMYKWLYKNGKVDKTFIRIAEKYIKMRNDFIKAIRKHAYNSAGYFNGYFNDNGKWLLCENDPDGEKRVYLVSNAWALISGCATEEMQKSVLENVEKECFGRMGYNTNSKGYHTFIEKAGRVGNGSFTSEAPYNHAQSFFVRACCECGDAECAYKATRYILPIEEEFAPVEKTFAPPYAIANGYSNGDSFLHRVQFQFLSGTVSYVLRTVYNFFFGITFGYYGLTLSPCLPKDFGNCVVEFTYLSKKFTIEYRKTQQLEKTVKYNGEEWETVRNETNGKMSAFFADSDFQTENLILIEY